MAGQTSWNGEPVSDINIEIDIQALANALLHNQKFIDAVAKAVRNQMLKDARTMKTLFRQWGGTSK
jgi:hypothetical protein